ncbi:Nn.00g040680.m01.CDS01 [Neocucurbitaria sp. VM-36]
MKDPVETAKQLIRTVVRMFYETEHIVVVDALCYHVALPMSDLVLILEAGKNSKHVGRIAGKLKEAGLCSSYSLAVMREGATKQTSREYFYIDWRRAIDACKYKIHKIDETVKKDAKPTAEKAELRCPRCKSQYTMMQALDHPDPDPGPDDSGFLCARCEFRLDEIDAGNQADDMDDTPAKFNKLFGPLLTLMEEIDKMKIPAVEGKDAIDAKIDLPRDKDIDPGTKHEIVETAVSRPTAVKGLDTGPEKISIQIGSSAEQNEKQRAADKARQEKIAMQNQLPSWHTQSTVIKDASGNTTAIKQEANGPDTTIKTESSDTKSANQNLDAVFAQIEAERRKKEEEDEDDEDDDEDEDEDEFEDVTVDTTGALPDAKRMKLESSAAPTPSNAATPVPSNGDGGDESEEDEFEDVN